jgi:hypothetical protein
MSIVTIANEAAALKEIWDSLTGCSIAWEVENTNLPTTCSMAYCVQGCGTRKGTWDDIPTGECEECGTQHDGIFGDGNLGGVIYQVAPGLYVGVAWSDPSVGAAQYTWAYGDLSTVQPFISKWGTTWFNATEISGAPSLTFNVSGVKIQYQPGFDPFKLKFSTLSTEEIENSPANGSDSSVKAIDPAELLKTQEAFRKALLKKS